MCPSRFTERCAARAAPRPRAGRRGAAAGTGGPPGARTRALRRPGHPGAAGGGGCGVARHEREQLHRAAPCRATSGAAPARPSGGPLRLSRARPHAPGMLWLTAGGTQAPDMDLDPPSPPARPPTPPAGSCCERFSGESNGSGVRCVKSTGLGSVEGVFTTPRDSDRPVPPPHHRIPSASAAHSRWTHAAPPGPGHFIARLLLLEPSQPAGWLGGKGGRARGRRWARAAGRKSLPRSGPRSTPGRGPAR